MGIDWEFLGQFKPYSLRDYPEHTVRLDLNESPYPPPSEIVEAVAREAARANRYPEPRLYRELAELIADYAGVEPSEVVVTAGGDAGLELLFMLPTRGDRSLVVLEPSFSMFRFYAKLFSWRVREIPLHSCGDEWCADPSTVVEASRGCSLAVFDQPNNPTGTGLLGHSVLAEVARSVGLLVVDEAYYEFSGRSHVDLLGEGNVVVVRTFSKAFSLAGLRLGYMLAPRGIAEKLRAILPPFNVSRASLAAGIAALRAGYAERVVRAITAERERLRTELASMGLRVYRSLTNFVLVDTGVEGIVDALAEKGVYVRRVPLGPTWMRVTVGSRQDNDRLVSVLQELLGTRTGAMGAGRG